MPSSSFNSLCPLFHNYKRTTAQASIEQPAKHASRQDGNSAAAAAAAASSSVQNEDTNSPPALSRARSATICVLSLLFACLATTTLRHIAAGNKEQHEYLISAAVVRGLSPLVAAYLLSLTVALQVITWDSATAFLRATCLLLLAAGVARLVVGAPIVGAAAMFLVTVDSAVVLGGALAVLRQRAGTKLTAVTTAMSASPYQSRAEVRHARWCRTAVEASAGIVAVATSVSVAIVMWFAPEKKEEESHHGGGGEEELFLFVVMVFAGPLLVVTRQLFFLEGSPLQVEASAFLVNSVVAVVGWIVPIVVADGLVGGNAPGIVIWAGTLGLAGFFGYGRAVDAVFEELMAVKRSEPRTAVDASGLLVGRDEEDACSAHIDAFTSVCLDCAVRPGCRC